MRRYDRKSNAEGLDIDLYLSGCLHRVGMEQKPRALLAIAGQLRSG